MSERISGLSIGLTMDTADVRRSVSSIKDSFREVRSSARVNLNNIKFDTKDIKTYKGHVDELSKTYEAQEKNVKDLKARHDELVATGRENTQEGQRLRTEYNKQVDELNRLGHAMEEAKNNMHEMYVESSSFTKIGNTLRGVGDTMQGVGQGMKNVGGSLTKWITMPALAAATAVGGIAASFGWGRLVSLDTAQAKLKGLGYSTEDVGRISDQVTNAIEGGMTTMAEGVDIAAGAMAAGVEEGAELEKYIQLVGDAAVGSGRPVAEMSQIFNRVQGSGRLMTQELNQIEHGMPGFSNAMAEHLGVTVDELREMVTAGEVTSDDFLTVMDDFAGGMAQAYAESWQGMVGNTKNYIGILGENLLSGVFEQSKDSLREFEDLMRSEELQQWATEAGEAIAESFGKVIQWIKDGINWFMSLESSTQKLIGVFAAVAVAIGPVLTVLGSLIIFVGSVVSAIAPLFTALGGLVGGFKTVMAGIKPFAVVFPKLAGFIGILTGPIGLTVAALVGLGAAFVAAYAKSETFRDFIGELVGTIIDFGQQVWSNFMDLVIPAVQAVGDFFQEMFQKIRAFWESDGKQVMEAIGNAIGIIQSILSAAMPVIIGIIQVGFNIVLGIVKMIWENIKGVISGAIDIIIGIVQVFTGIFTGDFSKMWEGVKNIFSGAIEFIWNLFQLMFWGRLVRGAIGIATAVGGTIRGMWQAVTGFFRGMFTDGVNIFTRLRITGMDIWVALRTGVVNIVSRLWNGVKSIWDVLRSTTTSIFNGLRATLSGIWNGIRTVVINTAQGLWNAVRAVWNTLNAVTRTLFGGVRSFLTNTWSTIRNTVVNTATNLWNRVRNIWNTFRNVTSTIFNAISSFLSRVWNGIRNTVVNVVTGLWNRVRTIWNTFNTVTRNIFNRIQSFLTNTWNTIRNRITNTVSRLWNAVRNTWNTFNNTTNSIFNRIRNFLSNTWSSIRNTVTNTVQRLWNGVRNIWNTFRNTTSNIFNNVRNFLTRTWNNIRNTVTNTVQNLWNRVQNIWNTFRNVTTNIFRRLSTTLRNTWNTIRNNLTGIASNIWNRVRRTFNNMKNGLSNIIDGISDHIGGMVDSVKKGLNKLIDGVNWVAGKIGMEELPKLKLSTGTTHTQTVNRKVKTTGDGALKNDTIATVGDRGRGNGPGGYRNEIIQYPNGRAILTPNRDTTAYLPKGSKVFNGQQTHDMMNRPRLSVGTAIQNAGEWIGNTAQSAWQGTKNVASNVASAIGDVWDYATNPGKLVDKVLDTFGVNLSDFNFGGGTLLKDMFTALYGKLKDGIKNLFTGWLDDGGGGDGSSFTKFPVTAGYSPDKPLAGYPRAFNNGRHYGIDYKTPSGTTIDATNSGTVSRLRDLGGGLVARLVTGKFTQFFMHLRDILKTGSVTQGDAFAVTGNSGRWTTGPHLHYQVERGNSRHVTNKNTMDPEKYLAGNASEGGSGQWDSQVKQALRLNNLPVTKPYIDAWKRQIQTESSGNPNAVQQIIDVNSGGNEARGLVQVIPPTFDAYKLSGMNNIMNPLHNLAAGMNYAKNRYGTTGMLNRIGKGIGYKRGGLLQEEGFFYGAEGDKEEMVVPLNRPSEAMKLLAIAAKKMSGKGKSTSQLPNPTGGNKNHEEMMMKMQQQIDLLTQLVMSSKNIEAKELKIGDNQIGQANDRYSARQSSRQSVKTGRISYV